MGRCYRQDVVGTTRDVDDGAVSDYVWYRRSLSVSVIFKSKSEGGISFTTSACICSSRDPSFQAESTEATEESSSSSSFASSSITIPIPLAQLSPVMGGPTGLPFTKTWLARKSDTLLERLLPSLGAAKPPAWIGTEWPDLSGGCRVPINRRYRRFRWIPG
jgi:hypothetical protein